MNGVPPMKCSDVQKRLSAHNDSELTAETHKAVASHLAECEVCASKFAEFESITRLVQGVSTPKVPPAIWGCISENLNAHDLTKTPNTQTEHADRAKRSWMSLRYLTPGKLLLAASVLLLIGFGSWNVRQFWNSQREHQHAAEFITTMDHYLQTLSTDPNSAEQFLVNKYNGQPIDPGEAIQLVGYRPAVAEGLPDGYSLASTSVLKMPCCACVKSVCKREDGSTLVLFEHDDKKVEWFGQRRNSIAMCGDKECCLVELEPNIAATWKRGPRSVTAVGVRDVDEVNMLVSWLESKLPLK